ncbi:hypothetical protein Tco_1100835 [Tanacetum coccineum]
MLVYLERPTDNNDFTEIVDFLNANPIRYALTIHALVDGKKIVITESSVRRDLQFADEDGTESSVRRDLQFEVDGYLSPKKTAWNELSSNIASAIICLATNQKFNFSKIVFDELEKIFSGKVTPLFDTMLIQHQLEVGDNFERAATTASSLEVEHVSGNITKTRSKATLNEPTPQGTGLGSGPMHQDTMGDTIAQTRFENVSKTSYDSPLGGVNTRQSDEDSIQLKELMEMCTNLLQRVQNLKTTKTAQAKEITSLKKRVNKLEQRGRSRTPRLKRLYKVGTSRRVESSAEESLDDQEDASKQGRNIAEIDADVDISLVHKDAGIQGRFDDEDMFDISVFNDEEVFAGQDMADQEVNVAEKEVSATDPVTTVGEVVTTVSVDISTASVPITVSTATPTTPPTTTTKDDMTLAETLMEIKSAKPKAIGVVMQEPSKAKMVEEEEPKEPTKIKDQIKHDEELAQRLDAQLQAEMEKEDRLARQREEEDNIVSWDNAQAMMEADYQMAERLHAEEQASLTDEEKASLFIQLLDARKKHFAALRAQEIRNKPPTKMQKRTTMCNYLKNMAGYKHNQLRHKSFDDIQKLFDKALKRVNTFVPMDTEKVEGSKAKAAGSETRVEESSKRAGEELDRESTKKQKVEDETEQAELKECFEIIPFDEDAVNTIPLATKQAPIVDYKITRDARKIYYHITRADGSTKVYMRFEDMLKMFDREDLEVLYRIVKDRFKSTKPVGDNRVLWGNLMTMFEPSAGDEMWREQGRYLIKSWKLIDSCGVHCLMLESMYIYMLVEKEYPLAQFTYRRMWEGKLQVDYECEMAFELLSQYHKSMETIGIPPDKHETDENEEGKPLSALKSSEVSAELF